MKRRAAILVGWLLVQILALALGAMRVPLTARAGNQPQHLALPEMIIVQMGVATMLFPVLEETTTAAAVGVTALPFLQLAGFLTFTPWLPLVAVSVAVLSWIGGLRLWGTAIRSPRNRMTAVAVLNGILIGGPLLAYLIREFSDPQGEATFSLPAIIDPLQTVVWQSSTADWSLACLAAPAALLASGAILITLQRQRVARAKLST